MINLQNLLERSGNAADSDWLWTSYKTLLRNAIEQQWGWDEFTQRAGFKTHLPARKFKILTLNESQVAAYLVKPYEQHLRLEMILVPEEFQGHGLGKHIMRNLTRTAVSEGKSITLDVIKANPVTGFYEKLGFQRVADAKDVYTYKLEPHCDLPVTD